MSDTPVVGKIEFSSVANPNTWDIGESKCLVFASPSEAKRAEELFSAMQRDLTAALAKLAEVEAELSKQRGIANHESSVVLNLKWHLERVEAEQDALKEDAKLLDWLEKNPRHAQIIVDGESRDCVFYGISADNLIPLRVALDAARKKEPAR